MVSEEAVAEPLVRGSDDTDELEQPKLNYVLKLDMRLIPILGITFTILFLDRTNSTYHRNPWSCFVDTSQLPMLRSRVWSSV